MASTRTSSRRELSVQFFHAAVSEVCAAITSQLGPEWAPARAGLRDEGHARVLVAAMPNAGEYLLVPVADWTLGLNRGVAGTDFGVLPSRLARDHGILSVRAVDVAGDATHHEARILAVYSPDALDDLNRCRRAIHAADDGGTWSFGNFGVPYPFERAEAYGSRRVQDRFSSAMLTEYLRALGVPVDASPSWAQSVVIRRGTR